MRRALVPILLLAAATTTAAAPIPAPVLVEGPLDVPPGVHLTPAVTAVDVGADGALVVHHLALGGGDRTTFHLEARGVTAGPDGMPRPGPVTDAVRLPADEVTLDPGERATITSAIVGGAGSEDAVAVVAAPPGGASGAADATVVAYTILSDGGAPPPTPSISGALAPDRLTVTLEATQVTAATLRVRLGAVGGPTVVDETFADLLVLADAPRQLTWELDLGPWPGPYRLEAVARAGDAGEERLERTVWPPAPVWLPVGALVIVVAALAAWLVARRRSRPPRGDRAGGA